MPLADITTDLENTPFKLYPNPHDGNIFLAYPLPGQSKGVFSLYDINGKMIIQYLLTGGASYYYIDDISVIKEDTTLHEVASHLETLLPNIFTPNNDAINDGFKIKAANLLSLNLKIYNRWGVLVKELNDADAEWDGKTSAGLECSDGVYYYLLTALGIDDKAYDEKMIYTIDTLKNHMSGTIHNSKSIIIALEGILTKK